MFDTLMLKEIIGLKKLFLKKKRNQLTENQEKLPSMPRVEQLY